MQNAEWEEIMQNAELEKVNITRYVNILYKSGDKIKITSNIILTKLILHFAFCIVH